MLGRAKVGASHRKVYSTPVRAAAIGAALMMLGTTVSAQDAAPVIDPSDERSGVELRFGTWAGGGALREGYDKIAAEYIELDPRVDAISFEFQPFPRYHDVLNVGLATNNAPDIAWMNPSFVAIYKQAGTLRDLRPDLEATDGYALDDFSDATLQAWSTGDAVYAIPFSSATNSIYINREIWDAAGLPDPNETFAAGEWTWDYLRTAAKEIVDADAAPIGFAYKDAVFTDGWRLLEDLFSPFGAQPWDETGTVCQFTDQEMIDALTYFHDLMYVDRSHPRPGEQYDFLAGNIGAFLERPSDIADFADADFAFDLLPVPAGPAGRRPGLGAGAYSVIADGANADIAAQFVAYLSSVEAQEALSQAATPTRDSLQTLEVLAPNNPLLTEDQIQNVVLDSIKSPDATAGYRHWNWGPIDSASNSVFDSQILVEDADIAAATAAICESIEPFLVAPPA